MNVWMYGRVDEIIERNVHPSTRHRVLNNDAMVPSTLV